MRRDASTIKNSLNIIIDKLMKIAMSDNILTSDEEALIQSIKTDLTQVEQQLLQVLESDLSDDEFEDLLHQLLHTSLQNATKKAMEDGVVNYDERNILLQLNKLVEQIIN